MLGAGERERGGRLGHIGALDGIRGLAVAAVLLYHSDFPWMRGGHLGVTVFFALSGFLITALLLLELEERDIDLLAFWGRRVRRLVPASLLAIGVCVAYAWGAGRAAGDEVFGDGVAASLWMANWRFIAEGSSYADLFRVPSPLRHFWSLAVEEQFYVVMPAVVAVTARVAPARWRRAVLGVLLLATVVASTAICIALHPAGAAPLRSYFGTDARVAEPAIGALLALLLVGRSGVRVLPSRACAVLDVAAIAAAAGLVLLMARLTVWDDRLYRGGFLLAAALSAVVIAAATQGGTVAGRVLRVGPLRALGRISYGVYLFHWPVFLWISRSRFDQEPLPLLALRVTVTLVLAIGSYHLLEMPVRLGRIAPARGAVGWANAVVLLLAVLALVTGAAAPLPSGRVELVSGSSLGAPSLSGAPERPLPALSGAPLEAPPSTTIAAGRATTAPPSSTTTSTALAAGERSLSSPPPAPPPTSSTTSTTSPSSSPTTSAPGSPATTTTTSEPARAPLRIAVVGDSVANQFALALGRWGKRTGEATVLDVARHGCPIAYEADRRFAEGYPWPVDLECQWWAEPESERWERLAEFRPDVVVVEDGINEVADRRVDGWPGWLRPGQPVFDGWLSSQYRSFFDTINEEGSPVLLLNAPCADLTGWGDAARMTDLDDRIRSLNRTGYRSLTTGANRVLDLFTEVCPDGEYSQSLYGDDDARYDGLHFSDFAADVIVDRLVAPAVLSVTGRSPS